MNDMKLLIDCGGSSVKIKRYDKVFFVIHIRSN